MYKELYQYFILHRELQLPGIGTFLLERQPAEVDFANRQVTAPTFVIALHHGQVATSRKLYQWLSSIYKIGESEAVVRFNDFVFEVRNNILAGHKLEWKGLGILSKGLAGEIRFEPQAVRTFSVPLPAAKVLRENAEHVVRVGEQERTSVEMIDILQSETKRRNWNWVIIAVLLITAVIFIGYHFSENGLNSRSTRNRIGVQPTPEKASFRNIP